MMVRVRLACRSAPPCTISWSARHLRRSAVVVRRRRPAVLVVWAKKKDKAPNLETVQNMIEWTSKMQKQVAELRGELVAAQQQSAEEAVQAVRGAGEGSLLPAFQQVLNELLDRQERFFKEEREHWIAERASWREQEAELRNKIARLQSLLVNVGEARPQPSNAVVPEKIKQRDRYSASELAVEDCIQAAITAVDNGDVLSDDFPELLHLSSGAEPPLNGTTETDVGGDTKLETVKSPPTGPPPVLTTGDDDIYWVSQLQEALNQKGYFCGDDDVGDFYFGEGTQSALLTFQACSGLQETGTTDMETWKSLLGSELNPVIGDAKVAVPETEEAVQEGELDFAVLSEGDGGSDVHVLQVLLETGGYSCGGDDMMWWHYGDDTINAVKTFQACNGLPESGVADNHTWAKLIGTDKTKTEVLKTVEKAQLFEEDLTKTDGVWLVGEQRWERKL